MNKDQRQTQEAQPQMPAHPRLRAPQPVDRNSFSSAEQPRENHEGKSHAAKPQSRRRAPHRLAGVRHAVDAIEQQYHAENYQRRNEPAFVRAVNAHEDVLHARASSADSSGSPDALAQALREEISRLD